MDIDGSRLWCWLLAVGLVLVLHGAVKAVGAGLEKIKPKIKFLAEKDRDFANISKLLEKQRRLEFTFLTESCVSGAAFTLLTEEIFSLTLLPFISDISGLDSFWCSIINIASAFFGAVIIFSLSSAVGERIGWYNAEKLLKKSSRFVRALVIVFMPLQSVIRFLEWLFGGHKYSDDDDAVTEEDFLLMVDAGNENGLIEESQKEMINNIIGYDEVMVSNVMTHRTELVAVDVDMKINDVVYLAMNEGYSRMPVYQGNIDNIIGVLMVKDLLGLIGAEDISNFGVRHFMRAALFVPETARCKNVLEDMLRDKAQLAVAVDEYGGTAGIVTMEDLLEEIVGSIRDEYDDEEIEVKETSRGVFTIEGTADPEETLEQLGLTLPEDQEFDTMSAWLVEKLGRIPDEDEAANVVYEGVRFTVLLIEENWISKIKAEIIEKPREGVSAAFS